MRGPYGKLRRFRISVVLAGAGVAALLLGVAWMKGWLGGKSAPGASDGKELVYELGNGVRLTLCWCPPGTFLMGSSTGEKGRQENEGQRSIRAFLQDGTDSSEPGRSTAHPRSSGAPLTMTASCPSTSTFRAAFSHSP